MKVHRVVAVVGMIFFLMGSGGQAQPTKVFDPWKLGPFIEGDEVPPQDMVILLKGTALASEAKGSAWYDIFCEISEGMEEASNGLVATKYYGGGIMGGVRYHQEDEDEADPLACPQ